MKYTVCIAAALFALTGFVVAQDKKPKGEKKPPAETKPAAEGKSTTAEKTSDVAVGSLTFKVPASWKAKEKLRQFSKAGYTIPGKEKTGGVEADLFPFEGELGGGDVPSNISRWRGQFKAGDDGNLPEPKKEELTFGDQKAVMVTLKGTFFSGSVSDAEHPLKEGYTMTGVIIETADGKVILKFTGPDAAMTAALPEIKKLVGSAFPAAK